MQSFADWASIVWRLSACGRIKKMHDRLRGSFWVMAHQERDDDSQSSLPNVGGDGARNAHSGGRSAACARYWTASRVHQCQGVTNVPLHSDIAERGGQTQQVEIGVGQRVEDGHGIVDAGISVADGVHGSAGVLRKRD